MANVSRGKETPHLFHKYYINFKFSFHGDRKKETAESHGIPRSEGVYRMMRQRGVRVTRGISISSMDMPPC